MKEKKRLKKVKIEVELDELIECEAGAETYNQLPRKQSETKLERAANTNQQFINSLQSKEKLKVFFFLSVNSMNLLICWIWWNKKVL